VKTVMDLPGSMKKGGLVNNDFSKNVLHHGVIYGA
jgi:hypothetical protein